MGRQQSIVENLVASWTAATEGSLNGQLHPGRKAAFERFRESGLPAPRSESWKYTPIRRIVDRLPDLDPLPADSSKATSADIAGRWIAGLDAFRVVLVDGRFRADLSEVDGLPERARIADLRDVASDPVVLEALDGSGSEARDAFADLNSAFVLDGVLIELGPDVSLPKPIAILHVASAASPSLVQPRVLGVFGNGSAANLIESCISLGEEAVLTNSMVEVFTSTHANVDHIRIVDENQASVHINNLRSYQERESHFSTNVITLSGGVVRNQAYFLPDGEHCETHLSGFYLAQDGAHIDNHTLVDHAKPECYSNELFKGILSTGSTGVFNGKVLVRMDAQKINAYQSNKSVLLDETARMYAKPELEIYADDVKCSHGATTGELDHDAMFYLRTRGIRPDEARLMLLQAFARDVLERIRIDAVRAHVENAIRQRLSAN